LVHNEPVLNLDNISWMSASNLIEMATAAERRHGILPIHNIAKSLWEITFFFSFVISKSPQSLGHSVVLHPLKLKQIHTGIGTVFI
jgi:hypothetical protein